MIAFAYFAHKQAEGVETSPKKWGQCENVRKLQFIQINNARVKRAQKRRFLSQEIKTRAFKNGFRNTRSNIFA